MTSEPTATWKSLAKLTGGVAHFSSGNGQSEWS
jgi:hypothetical protein